MSDLDDDVNNALVDAAFPLVINNKTIQVAPGLQKRELFAALCMARIARPSLTREGVKLRAEIAVAHADALIAALAATGSESNAAGLKERGEGAST